MHLTSKGQPCYRPDDHNGSHKTRAARLTAQARYKRTAKGMITDLRYEAKRRRTYGQAV